MIDYISAAWSQLDQGSEFWIAIGTVGLFFATLLLAFVGWFQIGELRRESKKWRTIEACELYDKDPILHACLKEMREYRISKEKGDIYGHDVKIEVISVLNYLDGIAIGVKQGLYYESIVKDHLSPIIVGHIEQHIISTEAKNVFGVEKENFKYLIALANKWEKEDKLEPSFKD